MSEKKKSLKPFNATFQIICLSITGAVQDFNLASKDDFPYCVIYRLTSMDFVHVNDAKLFKRYYLLSERIVLCAFHPYTRPSNFNQIINPPQILFFRKLLLTYSYHVVSIKTSSLLSGKMIILYGACFKFMVKCTDTHKYILINNLSHKNMWYYILHRNLKISNISDNHLHYKH